MMIPLLSTWQKPFKTWASFLIITLLIGYGVSLLQVYDRSHLNMQEVVKYYRGDDSDPSGMSVPQSFASILSVTHVHSFSQPFIFGFIGLIYCFSKAKNCRKSFLIALGFIGIIISNSAAWLIRYYSPSTVYLYPISQSMVALSLLWMSFSALWQMWFQSPEGA